MPAGFCPLRDDRIDATPGEPNPFAQCRRRAHDLAAALLHARKQIGCRQTEMEADDVRPQLLDREALRLAEWRMSRGKRALSAAMTVPGAIGTREATLATWPRAWTPESVRLAPTTRISPRTSGRSASMIRPWTVGAPG